MWLLLRGQEVEICQKYSLGGSQKIQYLLKWIPKEANSEVLQY